MITVYDVAKWLENDFDFKANKYVSPTLSMKEEKVFCVQRGQSPSISSRRSFDVLPIDLYIHWNTDDEETEEKATEVYKTLYRKTNFCIEGQHISFLAINEGGPINMGKDEANIYNKLISFDLAVDKNNN